LFEVRRSDIETFGRELEANGRVTATIARRLCTVTSFYRYAEEEGLIAHSPAVHVRRPRIDYESHAIGLDRNEVGGLLVAAGLGPAAEHALVSLLALNGLRVSEAIGANIEALGLERGHRTLTVVRKGGKTVTVPLAPRTARAVDLAVGERPPARASPPATAGASTVTAPLGSCGGSPSGLGSPSRSARTPPPRLHHRRTRRWRAATRRPRSSVARRPRTTMRYDRARVSLDRQATYIVSTYIAGAAR
jgi:integrase/recombinase XerD